jgi:hypothetical protein
MSDFVFLLRSSQDDYEAAMGTAERAQKSLEGWMAWIDGLKARGQLKNPGIPLERSGKLVRGSRQTVSDGPFAEAKDIVIGFIVVTAPDLQHALDIAKTCPIVLGGGAVEVRPVVEAP